jgi:hypothetical protein
VQDRVRERLRGGPIRQVIAFLVADQRAALADVQEKAGQIAPPRSWPHTGRPGIPGHVRAEPASSITAVRPASGTGSDVSTAWEQDGLSVISLEEGRLITHRTFG